MMTKSTTKTDKTITILMSGIYSAIMTIWILVHVNISMPFDILGISAHIDANNISNYLGVFSIHFTTVFLTTGLMSTLGAKEDLIYHIDIVQHVLLKPVGRSFKALSVYSFLTLLWATVAFIFRSSYMVIFTAVTGVIIVTCLFFKMISIYFEREKAKEKIKKILKEKESLEGLHRSLIQLHLIMRSNIQEKQISSLVENMALLIELYQYFLCMEDPIDLGKESLMVAYGDNIPERKSKYVLDFLLATDEDIKEAEDISIFEIYVKIHAKFWAERERKKNVHENNHKKRITKQSLEPIIIENSVSYAAESVVKYWGDKRRSVVHKIYKINNIVNNLLENYTREAEKINSKEDYQPSYEYWGSNKFLDLAEKIFKSRMAITSEELGNNMPAEEHFYQDIKVLLNKDEQRIKNGDLECSKEFCDIHADVQGHVYCYSSILITDENETGCFVRNLPRLGLKYVGKDINRLLKHFYDMYKITSCDNYREYLDMYYDSSVFRPRDEKTYEIMLCFFFQGCTELIMSGKGADIIDTVAELLFDFWKTSQFYKESDSLKHFYKDSFACIGCRLLYIDDGSQETYNEHPEDVQKFLSQLIKLCKRDERPYKKRVKNFDAEIVFADLLDTLEKYSPEYYAESAVASFKEIIEGNKQN